MPNQEVFDIISRKTDEHEFYSGVPDGYSPGKTKFVVVTGSVMSGVGKGIVTACLGNLLTLKYGLNISPVKFDGYLNYDAGTMNPFRHGEVFVMDDGTECDLDLGSYERFLNKTLSKDNYLTSGKIFKIVIDKERAGKYLGRDVQFIPHLTGEIKNFLRMLALKSRADVILVETGGTVGELENGYFLEAMRELAYEEGPGNMCFINVTYIMRPGILGEHKSKAAQLGIKELMSLGIQPDIIVCRSEKPVSEKIREKISIYSNIPVSRVINSYNIENVYEVPEFMAKAGIDKAVLDILGLHPSNVQGKSFEKWEELARKIKSASKEIVIGMAGKYTNVHDSYISIMKALEASAPHFGAKIKLKWIETSELKKENVVQAMQGVHGLIVPGGFGERGTKGKIECIRHARENNVPFLGLCYGMQMGVIEFARNVCGLENAHTTEIEPKTEDPVVCILPEQEEVEGLGGTMRLGGFEISVKPGTLAHKIYGKENIRERFRHRWNVNTKYIEELEKKGLVFSGNPVGKRIMQIMELPSNRFHFGTQFHPEFTSRPLAPSPVFMEFVKACSERV